MGLPAIVIPRTVHAYEPGQPINPNISPLRVVRIHDANMTTDAQVNNTWGDQEKLVNAEVIGTNIDRMACALAQEKNAADAWKAIFIKPPRKAWSDTVVAIKTNHIAQQHTRSPVMAKICHVLTDIVGVKAQNIHIYDGCHGASISRATPFAGLPEGVRVENKWGGSNTNAPVPRPWTGGAAQCLGPLARGEVDILVNVPLCKGHSREWGNFTMSMKNHFGTFKPRHAGDSTEYLIAINKSAAILGAADQQGKILFPRQQLILLDALWASRPGPGGNPTHQPNRLFMGTLGPVFDYQVATKFRRDSMGWPINEQVTKRFLTESGFQPEQLPADGRIINAMDYA